MTNLTLKNKTALITGASGSIGSAISKKLSKLGCKKNKNSRECRCGNA